MPNLLGTFDLPLQSYKDIQKIAHAQAKKSYKEIQKEEPNCNTHEIKDFNFKCNSIKTS